MTEYVIGFSKNDCGYCLTTRVNWEKQQAKYSLRDDHNEVHSFIAGTWEDAKLIYETFLKKRGYR